VSALETAGFVVSNVADDLSGWTLTATAPHEVTGAGAIELTMKCSPTYPLTPPTVYADQLGLEHHQNPFSGELCLLEQPTKAWKVTWTLAEYVSAQLGKAIAAGKHGVDQSARTTEADQGEPFSLYYTYKGSAGILIDTAGTALKEKGGELSVSWVITPSVAGEGRLLGLVNHVVDGTTTHQAAERLGRALMPGAPQRAAGRWQALDTPPREQNPAVVWRTHVNAANKIPAARLGNVQLQLLGLTFPEERSRDEYVNGWLFIVRQTDVQQAGKRRVPVPAGAGEQFHFVRAYHASKEDLTFRAPSTAGLPEKSVTIIGCGAIGSVIAEHLARAGVGRFTLIDEDQLEPGNLSRHSAGFDAVGMNKVDAVALRIAEVNPLSDVTMCAARVGTGFVDHGRGEIEVISHLFSQTDLVIDATADISLQQLTAALALDSQVSWLLAEGTTGLGGGAVVTSPSRTGGCYWCYQFHQAEGALPTATIIETEEVQPAGCGQRTFTGTGFDLAVISAQAARVAVGVLLEDLESGYPRDAYDAHILTLREPDGTLCPPSWDGYTYERHPNCWLH